MPATQVVLSESHDGASLPVRCLRPDIDNALCTACARGNTAAVQQTVDENSLTVQDLRGDDKEDFFFGIACDNGCIETARWLADRCGLTAADICANECGILASVCDERNGLETAQWLVSHFALTADNVRAGAANIMYSACFNYTPECAQWFVDRFQFTADEMRVKEALCHARLGGCNDTAAWLVERFGFSDDAGACE